jgi:hypothetical protein
MALAARHLSSRLNHIVRQQGDERGGDQRAGSSLGFDDEESGAKVNSAHSAPSTPCVLGLGCTGSRLPRSGHDAASQVRAEPADTDRWQGGDDAKAKRLKRLAAWKASQGASKVMSTTHLFSACSSTVVLTRSAPQDEANGAEKLGTAATAPEVRCCAEPFFRCGDALSAVRGRR